MARYSPRVLVLALSLLPLTIRAQYPEREMLVVPAAASAHGLHDTYWRTDLWLTNQSSEHLYLRIQYLCRSGCGPTGIPSRSIALAPNQTQRVGDVIGAFLNAPDTSGAIAIYPDPSATPAAFFATSRTYTTAPSGDGSYGVAIPAIDSATQVIKRAMFIGLASSGRDRTVGFRTNVGVTPTHGGGTVTYHLKDSAGETIGVPLTLDMWRPQQIDDIFGAVGAGDMVTQNAVLEVTTTASAIPYAIVIDNRTGDAVFLPGAFAPVPR